MRSKRGRTMALVSATHFPQALAMVALATGSCALLGLSGWPLVMVVIATASGQASVGWSNDYLDSKIDSSLNRQTKPVVRDGLNPADLKLPILISLVLVAPFSFLAAGVVGGVAHILAVVSAWIYNIYLSRTVWSWVSYAFSFAMLPLFIAQAVSSQWWPSWAVFALSVTVGVLSHLLNALPDIQIDRQAGLGGLAVTLGKVRSRWLSVLLFALALFFAWAALASYWSGLHLNPAGGI